MKHYIIYNKQLRISIKAAAVVALCVMYILLLEYIPILIQKFVWEDIILHLGYAGIMGNPMPEPLTKLEGTAVLLLTDQCGSVFINTRLNYAMPWLELKINIMQSSQTIIFSAVDYLEYIFPILYYQVDREVVVYVFAEFVYILLFLMFLSFLDYKTYGKDTRLYSIRIYPVIIWYFLTFRFILGWNLFVVQSSDIMDVTIIPFIHRMINFFDNYFFVIYMLCFSLFVFLVMWEIGNCCHYFGIYHAQNWLCENRLIYCYYLEGWPCTEKFCRCIIRIIMRTFF